MNLKKTLANIILAATLLMGVGGWAHGQERPTTVRGYVLDSSCAFIKNLQKPISPKCAVSCAKAGSPLVILGVDGTIYWPISDSMPATGQNQRLIQYAGQRVTVSGKVFIRGGSHAMVIERIEGPRPSTS